MTPDIDLHVNVRSMVWFALDSLTDRQSDVTAREISDWLAETGWLVDRVTVLNCLWGLLGSKEAILVHESARRGGKGRHSSHRWLAPR